MVLENSHYPLAVYTQYLNLWHSLYLFLKILVYEEQK